MVELLTDTVCPACGKEMRAVYVPEIDINVNICTNGCGGVYFSKKEVWNFENIKNNIDVLLNQFKQKHYKEVEDNKIRICPSCGAKMVKFGISGSIVKMDMCYSCGGRFLSYKELIDLCSENYDISMHSIINENDQVSRNYYDILSFIGTSSEKQDFEKWIKKYI